MKFVNANPLADPETAARKLIEIANSVEAVQDGRIYIEKVNGPFLFDTERTVIRRWDKARRRARMDRDARERDVPEVYAGRRA